MKKKVILSSLLSIVVCISMIAGSTFALFTSESKVNIAVTSGKVEVVASLDNLEYKTLTKDWQSANGTTTEFDGIGGDAVLDGGNLTLRNIVPGDGVRVDVVIKNKSNVVIQYLVKTTVTGENAEELQTSILTTEGTAFTTGWQTIEDGGEVEDLTVTVELPETATVQNVKANITITVSAVQGNAPVNNIERDIEWYTDANAMEYTLDSAKDLAGLAALVNGTYPAVATLSAEETTVEISGPITFKTKTFKLDADVDLGWAEWEPIGTSSNISFQGTFDGQCHTVSNLYISGNKSDVGLFGFTKNGEIKNLTVENANVTGYLDVAVVAGTPYTSKYTNVTVKGNIQVNGFSYVGAVGGKNAYANWTDVSVQANVGSYVKANSVAYDPNSKYADENGNVAYRTYVGGAVGFMGEGGHVFTNVSSNIDVFGSSTDVGGLVGIAHYNNSFINCTVTGNVTITDALDAIDAEEIGGIAGVWHNENGTTVTFENCSFTGKLSVNVEGVDLSDNTITGKAYSSSGTGTLIINKTQI